MSTGAAISNIHVKRFPVRLAMEIGTGGSMSVAIGRVDAGHGAIRDLLYQTQLPVNLHCNMYDSSAVGCSSNSGGGSTNLFMAEESVKDIENKLHMIAGLVSSMQLGVVESCGLLTGPLALCGEREKLARVWSKQFKIDFRILGHTTMNTPAASSGSMSSSTAMETHQQSVDPRYCFDVMDPDVNIVTSSASTENVDTDDDQEVVGGSSELPVAPTAWVKERAKSNRGVLDGLAFSAYAAASKCMRKENMLAIVESDHPSSSGNDHHHHHGTVGNGGKTISFLGLVPAEEKGVRRVKNEGIEEECGHHRQPADVGSEWEEKKRNAAREEEENSPRSQQQKGLYTRLMHKKRPRVRHEGSQMTVDSEPPVEPRSEGRQKERIRELLQGEGQELHHKDSSSVSGRGGGHYRLKRFDVPFNAQMVHRALITDIQRRNVDNYSFRTSPNPVMRGEYLELRNVFTKILQHSLSAAGPSSSDGKMRPADDASRANKGRAAVAGQRKNQQQQHWVLEKAASEGVICGTSGNGGMLNTAARIAGQTMLGLDRLETHAQYQYCGMTDVLLSENYKDTHLIVPHAAFCSAIMRSLCTPRIQYLPEVSIAAALLVHRGLWQADREVELKAELGKAQWYSGGAKHRTFRKPHSAMYGNSPNPNRTERHAEYGEKYSNTDTSPYSQRGEDWTTSRSSSPSFGSK